MAVPTLKQRIESARKLGRDTTELEKMLEREQARKKDAIAKKRVNIKRQLTESGYTR